jgi:hypothetical protein
MKNCLIRCILIAVTILLVSPVASADNSTSNQKTLLVIDRIEDSELVAKQFRTTVDVNNKALKKLKASASGQFSAAELEQLLAMIPAEKKHIWIVDVRQESHGFINGIPISWTTRQNRINVYKTPSQIAKEEQQLLNELSKKSKVKIYTAKKLAEGDITAGDSTTIVPHSVQTEEQLVTSLGANYLRFYVLDHHRPDDNEVDSFVSFIKYRVQPDDWLHFHCRGGKGRSSTFLAMYDIIRNANNSNFSQIMQRQADMGNVNFEKLPSSPDKIWKRSAASERYEFLKEFYAYAVDPSGYDANSWSSWIHNQK